MAEGWRMWAISLLTMMLLLPLLLAAPLDIAGDIKKADVKADNDGMHSHDENVTRRGKFFGHNQFDVGNINVAGSVSGDVVSIGHEVKIDVHGHTHDHHHREDDTVIECKEGIRELFKSIDSNRNGLMDVKELLRVCHQNNIKITKPLAVRILTLSDKTVGFNMAKFCELLKDCQSTNSVDVIYFLLQPYDKVAGCSRDEIEKLCWCPRDYSPVCAGGRLYNNLCLHECARKEAECADVQAIPAVGDIAECVDPSTKGIVNRDAIKEFKMTLLDIENELANLVNSRRKRDGLGFTEEQLVLLNSIEKGYTYLDIECSNNDGQCHVEKIKGSIEETKSSFTAVKEAGRVSSGFLEHFILERGKFDKIADVAGKVQEKAAVKLPLQGIIVDGGWSAWSSWSDCTGTCGEETRTRTRACSSPAGGKSCPGAATEAESCGLPSCEELVREVSSCSFDDEYLAEPDCEGQCAFYTTSPFKWENQIIPYYFTSASDKDKELFRSVMDTIEKKTCFTFQEKTEVEYESKHSLEIEISSKSCATGCEGFVYPVKKRYSDNPTRLILESKTQVNDRQDCKCAGFVLHQLMHVLGVEHTHARKDRDKYITVNDANVKSLGMTNRFKICEDCELSPDVPYDCKSIMHDGSHSAGGLELMKPIDPTTCILSKSAPWLDSSTGSELDWKLLNVIGKCPGTSILIESLEKAGKHQGLALGLYDLMPDKVNDRPAYSQKKGTGFIYYNAKKGDWRVGPTLGKASDWLAVTSEKKVPPTDGWKYLDGVKWESDDSTLELTASLSEPTNDCNIIRMESTGASGTSHSSSMDVYEWTKEWLNGRKIYKGGNGHYLRISSLTGHWGIGLAKDGGSSVIESGFGTTCPCEPENINERDDWWTYLDAAKGTVDRNLKVTCGGNWGKWSQWSEVDSCDRQCGGGKQRFMKMRTCNNDPTECIGEESPKIKEQNCAVASCDCKNNHEGTVAKFCTKFPQEMSSKELQSFYTKYEYITQVFCRYDIEKKREALLFCERITPEIAEVLLKAALDSGITDCKDDTTSILVGDCGQLIRDKISQNCDEPCLVERAKAQRIIDEVTEKTSEVYEKQIEFQRWVELRIQKQKDLLEYANKNRDNDVNKQKEIIKTKRDEIMKKFEKKLTDNPFLSQDAKHKLRVEALYTLKDDTVSIKSVNVDLDKAKKKREKMEEVRDKIKTKWGNVKKNFPAITKADAFVKVSQAGGHILSSVKKFKKGGTLNVIGGVLDIATGIGQFLPPPAGIVTGTVSSIFSMITGDGAPSLQSTNLVIKNEFRKQKEYMEGKFEAIDDRFDGLSTEVKTAFKKILETIHDTVKGLRKTIEELLTKQTKEIKSLVLMKAVIEKTREAKSHWRALESKLYYILDQEGKKHDDLGYKYILDSTDVFGTDSNLFEFETMVRDECKAKSNQAIREYCQTLAFTALMMYRTNEIIITKTLAMIAESTLNTVNFIPTLERRKKGAKTFLTDIFTSTDEEEFSYISCGLSDESDAKLGAEQKKNLLEYADHLDPSLALRKELEGREDCVDGSYGEEWLPVDGDDITFKKKIEECCKIGKKTEKRPCSPPKNGGVDCDPSVLHLRCEGFLRVGYCPAFVRSKKGKICEGDNRVLKEFSEYDDIKSRDDCEEHCSNSKNYCWGCSVQNIDEINYKWNALTECKSIAVWDGKIEGDITRKPGNDIMIPGTVLLEGEFITSPNGENQLRMQNDGNLVLYRRKSWIWATHTEQKCSGCTFHFEIDDVDLGISYNLLLKDNRNKIIWKYPKLDVGADALELKDDGTLELTKQLEKIRHIPKVFIETKTANITFALSPHTNSGDAWGKAERCPFPYFSNKMELQTAESCNKRNSRRCSEWSTAVNAIRLTCNDGSTTTSSSEQWSSWEEVKECPEGSFIKKIKMREAFSQSEDKARIQFECTDGSQHHHGKSGVGTWPRWSSSCEDGSVVYGIQTRVEADDSDTIKDVIFLCGELPVDKYHIETPRITFPDDVYDYWGDWGDVKRCPFPHFANKMELKIEEEQKWGVDDTALNGIRLTCTDGTTITSSIAEWGFWGESKVCPEGKIKRTKLRREKPTPGDETSANGIRFECTDESYHEPGDGYWGSWSEWRSCGDGSAVYGIQTRVEASGGDDTALNDVRFFCARINPTVCEKDKINPTDCSCKNPNGNGVSVCSGGQRCTADGTCRDVFLETKTASITFGSPPNTNFWGDWGKTERCPFPHFTNKMELKIQASASGSSRVGTRVTDHTALNAIRLTCSHGNTITSSIGQWGEWRGEKACPEGSFIKKAEMMRALPSSGDNTAAENIKFGCTDGSEHHPVDGATTPTSGRWSGWSSCKDGSVVYGIQTRVADPYDKDKTALNDVVFLCGELPVDKYYIETPRITFPDDEDYWGDWGDVMRCPFPHFANKMELKIEEEQGWGDDDTALNGIRLTCTDGTTIASSIGSWGSWGEVKECTEGTIKRTKLRREIPGGDDTSANGIRFECTDGTSHKPGDGYWGSWSEWRSCGDGSAVYGIQTRVEDSARDDTALNDVRFFCAKIIIPTG